MREAQELKNNPTCALDQTKPQQTELNFTYYFDEYIGSVHLEALEMLSRQCNVKLEVLAKPAKLKTILTELDELFNSEKLNDDDEDSNDADDFFEAETFLKDFKRLIRNKQFDVEQFEVLMNQYAKISHFFMDLEKIIHAFKFTSNATRETSSTKDMVINFNLSNLHFPKSVITHVLN